MPSAPPDDGPNPAPGDLPEPLRGLPLDHVGIAVADLDDGAAPYRALGLVAEGDAVVAEQGVRVRILRAGPVRLELLAPLGGDGPIARFLERRGPGLHHLALRVADLDAEIARLRRLGARFIDPEPRRGLHDSRVVFLHPSWGGGVLLELVEPAGSAPG